MENEIEYKICDDLMDDILEYFHWSIQTFDWMNQQTGLEQGDSLDLVKAKAVQAKLISMSKYAKENSKRQFGRCYMCEKPFNVLTGKCPHCNTDMKEHYS